MPPRGGEQRGAAKGPTAPPRGAPRILDKHTHAHHDPLHAHAVVPVGTLTAGAPAPVPVPVGGGAAAATHAPLPTPLLVQPSPNPLPVPVAGGEESGVRLLGLAEMWTLAGEMGTRLPTQAEAVAPPVPQLPPIAAGVGFAPPPRPSAGVVATGDAAWRAPGVAPCFDPPLGAVRAAAIRTPSGFRPKRFRRLDRRRPSALYVLCEGVQGLRAASDISMWFARQCHADREYRRRVGDAHRRRAVDVAVTAPTGEYANVLDLRGDTPVSVRTLSPPSSGLCAEAIAASLEGYGGKDELLDVVVNGARFHATVKKMAVLQPDNPSALEGAAAREIDRINEAELAKGWLSFHTTPPFWPMRVYPMGFVWKTPLPEPGGAPPVLEGRPLSDYSQPQPYSCNCGGDSGELPPVNYGTFDSCAAGAVELRDAYPDAPLYIGKIDVAKAYRQVPNRPDELWMHCSVWRGGFLVNHRVGFGGYSSPHNFTLFEKAFQWAWRRRLETFEAASFDDVDLGVEQAQLEALRATDDELAELASPAARALRGMRRRAGGVGVDAGADGSVAAVTKTTGLLDDNIAVSAGALNALCAVREGVCLLREWGIPHNDRKLALEGVPRQRHVVFGVGLSLVEWTRSIPDQRRQQVAGELATVVNAEALPWTAVHSPAMRLLFFSRTVPRGRAHLNGMLAVVRGKGPGDVVAINPAARRGARWWHDFVVGAEPWSGVSLLVDDRPVLAGAGSDASDYGLGVFFRGKYTSVPWADERERALPIAQREAIALLCLVWMHRHEMAGTRVCLDQDNENVYYTWTNQRSQWPELYAVLDFVDTICAKFEIDLTLNLVKSADNPIPDALSRGAHDDFLAAVAADPVAAAFPLAQVPLPSTLRTLWRTKLEI